MLLLATLTASAQRLTAERTTIDVGRTGYQQPITAVFEFRKRGTRKVRIEKVVPDCNCTVVEYPKGNPITVQILRDFPYLASTFLT